MSSYFWCGNRGVLIGTRRWIANGLHLRVKTLIKNRAFHFLLFWNQLLNPRWVAMFLIFSSVQSLSRVWLFVTAWTAARQASLSIPNSQSLLKLISVESVMPSSHLSLCRPPLLPSVFHSIRVFILQLSKYAWQPTPAFLPGKFHGHRSLAGYSPWGSQRIGHDLATKPPPKTHWSLKTGCNSE